VPAKKPDDSFAALASEQQTIDQKIDLLIRAVDAIGVADLKDLRKWSEIQRQVYVDPEVAKAQDALELAVEKAAAS
jgi:hypothetical protein